MNLPDSRALLNRQRDHIIENLAESANMPNNIFWWGQNYSVDSDILVLHGLQHPSRRRQTAQLFVYEPLYLCRLALQNQLDFSLAAPPGLEIPPSALEGDPLVISIHSVGDSSSQDFVVVGRDVKFLWPCGFEREEFHTEALYTWIGPRIKGYVDELAEYLPRLAGSQLTWHSMTTLMGAELVLKVSGSSDVDFLVLTSPYFSDTPKVMHNVRCRSGQESDLLQIHRKLGARFSAFEKTILRNMEADSLNLLIIECDEGWFYVFCQGMALKVK